MRIRRIALAVVLSLMVPTSNGSQSTEVDPLARARSLELPTRADPPPGNPLEHYAAGYATVLCSAVFITGLDLEFATHNVGFFTAPLALRDRLGRPEVDTGRRRVTVPVPGGTSRVAVDTGGQGCVALPVDANNLYFTPKPIPSTLPKAEDLDWPMGDREPSSPLPPGLDRSELHAATDAAFAHADGMTAAFVVTWRGRIVAERYGEGIDAATRLESWSMGKSITASLLGVLMQQGIYALWDRAPIPEWREPGDPRAEIRIADLLRMSSGLRIRAPYDPDFDPQGPYPEHWYYYTGTTNAFHYAATRPLEWPPNTVGRYRNTDPVLVNYLIRLGVEGRGLDYLSFPQRALFDRIGIRRLMIETDPYGDLLTQGADLGPARDWARLGNLYLQDGVWNGERILPEGYVDFVSSLAPAWVADRNPVYGGFFWINGNGEWPIPKDAYFMAGAGGQYTFIIPSHDLVVVRLGHYRGNGPGDSDLQDALKHLLKAVPARL
jgi:CubicO group peptidase (beta-lactamase class C family)